MEFFLKMTYTTRDIKRQTNVKTNNDILASFSHYVTSEGEVPLDNLTNTLPELPSIKLLWLFITDLQYI